MIFIFSCLPYNIIKGNDHKLTMPLTNLMASQFAKIQSDNLNNSAWISVLNSSAG